MIRLEFSKIFENKLVFLFFKYLKKGLFSFVYVLLILIPFGECFIKDILAEDAPVSVETQVVSENKGTGPIVDRNIDYSPVGKRDPFHSFIAELKIVEESSVKNPLQRYEISQLKLIGIMTGIAVPKAMMEDPTGKGWIVKVGTNIGKHFGKIKKISPDSITVIEEYHDRFGKLTINEVEIHMNRKDDTI